MRKINTKMLRVFNPDTGEYEYIDALQGTPGYTPIRGVDYWTPTDQEQIVQQVIAALGTPVFGRVESPTKIVLTGNVAKGTYEYWYEDDDGKQSLIGTHTHGGATYTNLFVAETCTLNTRNNSSGATSPTNGCFVTDYIDLGDAMASGQTNDLHYKGMYFKVASADNSGSVYSFITYYKADKSFLGQDKTRAQAEQQTADGDYIKTLNASYTTARYIRVTAVIEPYTSDAHTYAALTSKDQLVSCKLALNQTITD